MDGIRKAQKADGMIRKMLSALRALGIKYQPKIAVVTTSMAMIIIWAAAPLLLYLVVGVWKKPGDKCGSVVTNVIS